MVMSSGTGRHWSLSCLQQPPQRSTNAQVGSQLTFGSLGISTGICKMTKLNGRHNSNSSISHHFTLRGLQSAERSLIISLAFCKTSGLVGCSCLGGAAFGCGPNLDIRSGTATLGFQIHNDKSLFVKIHFCLISITVHVGDKNTNIHHWSSAAGAA